MGRAGNNGIGRAGRTARAKGVGNMKHPGGRYGYRMEAKRERAQERNAARESRSPEEQIALLDKRLGKGKGATKERKRLHAQIAKGK